MRTKTGPQPITLAELRSFMHIDHEDDDVQLERCIEAGVDYIERQTERDIIEGDVIEVVDPEMVAAGTCVTLRRSPTLSLESVDIDEVAVELTEYTFRPNSHRRSRIVFKEAIPEGQMIVVYQTGMADDPTARQACLWAAAHFYSNREPEIVGATTSQFKNGLDRMVKILGVGGYA